MKRVILTMVLIVSLLMSNLVKSAKAEIFTPKVKKYSLLAGKLALSYWSYKQDDLHGVVIGTGFLGAALVQINVMW